MNEVKEIKGALTVRQQAELEVKKELADKAKEKMKVKLRDLAAAQAVVKGIELQIADLEQQVADGTV